jgi:hypothetical protein
MIQSRYDNEGQLIHDAQEIDGNQQPCTGCGNYHYVIPNLHNRNRVPCDFCYENSADLWFRLISGKLLIGKMLAMCFPCVGKHLVDIIDQVTCKFDFHPTPYRALLHWNNEYHQEMFIGPEGKVFDA